MTLEERAILPAEMDFDGMTPDEMDAAISSVIVGLSDGEADAVIQRAEAITRMQAKGRLGEVEALKAHGRRKFPGRKF
jgi:hypothetical protein